MASKPPGSPTAKPPGSPTAKPPGSPSNRTCAVCAKPASILCSNCHSVHYCSAQCQTLHWDTHRADCSPRSPKRDTALTVLANLKAAKDEHQVGIALAAFKGLPADQVATLIKNEAAVEIISVMRRCIQSVPMTALGLQAIASLAMPAAQRLWASALRTLFQQDCVDTAMAAERVYPEEKTIRDFSMAIVVAFTVIAELRVPLYEREVATYFVDVGTRQLDGDPKIVQQACTGLAHLAHERANGVRVFALAKPFMPLVFTKHRATASVLVAATALARNLVTDIRNLQDVFDLCGLLILSSMADHVDNAELCEHACSTLTNMSQVPANQLVLAKQGAAAVVLKVLAKHPKSIPVTSACLSLLANLSYSADNQKQLFDLGCAQAAIDCMKTFPDKPELLTNAACILANLSFNESNLGPLMAIGADAVLIDSLKSVKGAMHTEGDFCLRALANLASDPASRKQLNAKGALEVVQAVLDFVPESAELALANLKL